MYLFEFIEGVQPAPSAPALNYFSPINYERSLSVH
jgi:hypothetical protein